MRITKDFGKGLFTGFILSLFVIYSFFRIYWILEIGIKFFSWHAVLWLYTSLFLIFIGIGYFLYKNGKFNNPIIQKLYLICFGLIIGLFTSEIYLRITGNYISYSEQREGIFVNPTERLQETWYMTSLPNETKLHESNSEYSFIRITNSEGASDKEWTIEKDTNEIRIITLGDSFTEGDGCSVESAYPTILKSMLEKQFQSVKITVMNAGRCGSDPWFEYKKLEDRFLKYQPDIVIYTNGSNDLLYDHLLYGGMERFSIDSTIKNKVPEYWWIGLYEISHFFRAITRFFDYDETFFSLTTREKNKSESIIDSKLLSERYSELAQKNKFICIQLLHPEKSEIENEYYDFNLKELLVGLDTLNNYLTFDLMSFYKDSLGINSANAADYFWKIDGHHNSKGYEAMGKGVFSFIKPVVIRKINENNHRKSY